MARSIKPPPLSTTCGTSPDETHVPYYSLWIYNDSNPSLNRRLAYTSGTDGRCEQAIPISSGRYSGWRITQQVLDHLNLGSQDQAVLRVKVKWVPSEDDAPCQAPVAVFLDDFDQVATFDEDYPEIFAGGAGIGGESGETFAFDTFSVQIQGGNPATVFATTGSVNFQFAEAHSGSLAPSRFLWRWRDGNQYWSDGAWGSDDSFKNLNGAATDPLVSRWQWDETSGMVTPATTGAEPFSGLTAAFFEGTSSRTVIVETMIVFDNGGEETELPGEPLSLALSLNLPDFVIADFSLDAGSGETTEWHTAQGGLPDFSFTIDTTSSVAQDVYLSLHRGLTPLECGTLSSLAGNLFSLTESVNDQGNVRFILTADGTSGLATHLNGGTGVFTPKVGVDPCAAGQVPPPNRTVTITVNPSEGFLIRVHFRGHLGSSVISKAFSPVFDGSEAGQPMVLDLGDSPIHLYPRPTEHHHYDPFGQRIGNAGNEDDPRYTDHEFDTTSGFNYMKGRFQLPDRAKFNRPDPMRDWDWLNPHSLNLYQYVRNDPINSLDLTGLEEKLGKHIEKAFAKAGEILIHVTIGASQSLLTNQMGGYNRLEPENLLQTMGQTLGDLLTVAQGIKEFTIGGGGAIIGSPSGVATVVGVGVAAHGAAVGTVGGTQLITDSGPALIKGLVNNFSMGNHGNGEGGEVEESVESNDNLGKKKRNNPPSPDPEANGTPHNIIEQPGPDGQYTTHNGDGSFKQYRGSGKSHGGKKRPNVKDTKLETRPLD